MGGKVSSWDVERRIQAAQVKSRIERKARPFYRQATLMSNQLRLNRRESQESFCLGADTDVDVQRDFSLGVGLGPPPAG